MKKALSLILALVLCLGLCACGAGSMGTTAPVVTVDDKTFTEMSAILTGEWGFYLEGNQKYQYYVFNADKTCSWVTVAINQETQEHVVETTWTGTYVITDKEVILTLKYDDGSAAHTTHLTYLYLEGNLGLTGVKYTPKKGDWAALRNAIGGETPEETPNETPEKTPDTEETK